MSPVASALASITGSCNCGTSTVVISRTRSVHAASAPSSARASGLPNAIRSPQHRDENGPSSIVLAQHSRIGASRSGSITGIVIPTCTTAIVARRLGPTPYWQHEGHADHHDFRPAHQVDRHRHHAVAGVLRERVRLAGALEVPAGADAETRAKL